MVFKIAKPLVAYNYTKKFSISGKQKVGATPCYRVAVLPPILIHFLLQMDPPKEEEKKVEKEASKDKPAEQNDKQESMETAETAAADEKAE